MYSVHDLTSLSMGDAYDETQINRHIEDGDILFVKDGFAILIGAWPTMVEGESNVFHQFASGYTFDDLARPDMGNKDYRAQVAEIRTNPSALIARAIDPVAEREEEERAEECAWDQRQQYLLDDA